MNPNQAVVFMAIFIALVVGFIRLLDFIEKDAKSTWWVLAEGVYVDSNTQRTSHRIVTGMTGHYAKLPGLVWTTIIFQDGRREKTMNIGELPPPGTYIKIIKNGRADFKIETAK